MSTVHLPLSRGKIALIDAADLPLVQGPSWYAICPRGRWYAAAHIAGSGHNGRAIYLHRFLMDAPPDMDVDHINGDGLDCRRSNMRLCKHAQNLRNSRLHSHNTSGYRGVVWDKSRRKWMAYVDCDGTRLYLGRYETSYDAARVVDEWKRAHDPEFARLNFPDN